MKVNIIRGKLLEFLKKIYPEGTDRQTILSIFFPYHKFDDITAALEYLVDKEYILKKELPHPFLKQETVQRYKLTPKGVDLFEGNIPDDPGILIPKE